MGQKLSYHMLLGSSVSRLGKAKMGRRSRENLKWVECRLGHSQAVSLMEEVHPNGAWACFHPELSSISHPHRAHWLTRCTRCKVFQALAETSCGPPV